MIRNYESELYFEQSSAEDQMYQDITADRRGLFVIPDQQRLDGITLGDSAYAWFFDVLLYYYADYKVLLFKVAAEAGSIKAGLCRINDHSFEHLIFLMLRCLRKDAALIDLADIRICEISEFTKFHDLTRIKIRYGYEPT